MPDLFIAGAKIEDMDGLEHLEPFIRTTLPILIVTSRADRRTYDMLRDVRYDGIYDGRAEGLEHLGPALRQVIQHRLYISPSMVPNLKPPPRSIMKDTLTEKEHVVLSVIGDGSDNKQAAERLVMSREILPRRTRTTLVASRRAGGRCRQREQNDPGERNVPPGGMPESSAGCSASRSAPCARLW